MTQNDNTSSGEDSIVGVRMNAGLRRALEREAEKNSRDLSKEIRHRLAESLSTDRPGITHAV